MMSKDSKNVTVKSGISFSSLLFIVFFVLKVCNVGIVGTWSWFWVTSPLWIPLAVLIAVALIIFIILALRAIL